MIVELKELTAGDTLAMASRIMLFAKVYRALEYTENPLSAQEHFLMAMAAVKQQTGVYIGDLPNPETHYAGVKP